jgi:hypothetical protein
MHRQARRLSPNDPQKFSFNGVSALAYLFTGRFADAYVSAEAVVRALPRFLTSHCLAAVSGALSGRMSAARSRWARVGGELRPRRRA